MNQTEEPTQDVVKGNGLGEAAVEGLVPAKAATRNPRWLAIGGAAAVAALLAAVPAIYSAFTHESTDDAFIDAHISTIGARVAGQVTRVYVDDNQPVKQGDPLIEIDPPDYQVKLDQARAQFLSAEALARRTTLDLRRYQQLIRTD